jgi:two-component system alkaline phosphatase synthesis response regulator PhoP
MLVLVSNARQQGNRMTSRNETVTRATPEQMSRQHIFVVNGSAPFLDIIRELFQDENYNVTTTNFLPGTFSMIEAAKPSLLLIDLVIGEDVGWDLLVNLREGATTHDIPVILVSTTPSLLERAKDQHAAFGGDRYLTKPFDLDDLLTMVDDLVGKA